MSDVLSAGRRPHRGTLILVLGIIGLVACMPVGIAAWVMGNGDLAQMDRGEMDPEGRGMTKAGKILGIISVAWFCLVLVLVVLGGGCAALMGAASSGQ